MIAVERLIERPQQFSRTRVFGADDDPGRLHEVLDRGAFLEEFRVGDDVELAGDAAPFERRCDLGVDLVRRPDRDRRFVDDDAIVRDVLADGACDREHVPEIGRAVLVGRGTDGDEEEEAMRDARADVGAELKPPGAGRIAEDRLEPGFVNRDFAALEARDPVLVNVDAHNVIARVRETCAGDETDVTRSENGDVMHAKPGLGTIRASVLPTVSNANRAARPGVLGTKRVTARTVAFPVRARRAEAGGDASCRFSCAIQHREPTVPAFAVGSK